MRNAMNTQVWSFHHANFLCVSATHGSAPLALYDAFIWDKYQLGKLTKGASSHNPFTGTPRAAHASAKDYEDPEGVFSRTTTALRSYKDGARSFSPATTRYGNSP